ncbi:MAG: hypothetical protein QOJ51_6770, partial [Acidobacteriaceae bacterium]|nr:hypothetical protein [Acidobacteriaceae bacterium]
SLGSTENSAAYDEKMGMTRSPVAATQMPPIPSVTLHSIRVWLKFGARPREFRTYRAAGERGATQHLRVRTSVA